jgi:RND family efflux transporter MFP subunit
MEIALDRRSIKAPFAGTTGLSEIAIGDLVSNATAMTTLDDLSTIRVDFEVPERWAGRITQGQTVMASAQALPGSRFEGRITGIDNRIDPATRTLRLRAELQNPDAVLKTGMAIKVALDFASDRQLAVPTLSVQWDRNGSFVWKIVENAARRAAIDIVRRESGIVIVQGEIAAGDRVVVEGVQRLREGAATNEVGEAPTLVGPAGATPDESAPAVSGAEAPRRVRS